VIEREREGQREREKKIDSKESLYRRDRYILFLFGAKKRRSYVTQ
jgi:hypothetical protein